jgi:hypothetical protein
MMGAHEWGRLRHYVQTCFRTRSKKYHKHSTRKYVLRESKMSDNVQFFESVKHETLFKYSLWAVAILARPSHSDPRPSPPRGRTRALHHLTQTRERQ